MQEKENEIKKYLSILQRSRVFILVITTVCVSMAVFISIILPNKYRASSVLLVDTESDNVVNVADVVSMGSDYWSYKEYLKTQIEIVKSRDLALEIYKGLDLKNRIDQRKYDVKNDDSLRSFAGKFLRNKLNNLIVSFKTYIGKAPPVKDNSSEISSDALSAFRSNIKVEHKRDTRLIVISYEHENPVLAAEIVNAITNAFVYKNLERRIKAAKDARVWLLNEIDRLYFSLNKKELNLQEFRKNNDLISADERREILDRTLFDLNQKLNDAQSRLAEYSKKYREKHPKMQQTMELVSKLNSLIKGTRNEAISFEEKLIKFNELTREVDVTNKLLENILAREKETLITGSIQTNNISVVETAFVPERPVKPRRTINVLLSIILGIIGGSLWCIMYEVLKKYIHSSEDFVNYDIPFLGYVPYIKKTILQRSTYRDSYLLFNHKGIISEIFNNLRTSVLLSSDENEPKKCKSIVFTSFFPGEGKTLICCNLAVALAKFNFKTLILETDMRRSRIGHIFNVSPEQGLSDYLLGRVALDKIIVPSPLKQLDILVNVKAPQQPSELLGGEVFKNMIKELESRYDIILFDAPPVFAVTDPIILASIVKQVIVVAKYNSTPQNLISVLKERMDVARAKIIGGIINQVRSYHSQPSDYSAYYENDYY